MRSNAGKKTYRRVFCGLLAAAITAMSCIGAAAADEKPVLAPSGLLALEGGKLLIADTYHKALWLQDAGGTVSKLAGGERVRDANGDPVGGYRDGASDQAAFKSPWAAAPFLQGYAVTDTENNVVRYVGEGQVGTAAGTGKAGMIDGLGVSAAFNRPTGIAPGPEGSLFVADTGNNVIRKIDAKGNVTLYAGGPEGCASGSLTQARFREPTGLSYADGVLYVADSGNNRICKIENGTVSAVAGIGSAEGILPEEAVLKDGSVGEARFANPQGVLYSGGVLYVADTGNGAVRKIQNGIVSTLMQMGDGTAGMYPVSPRGLALVNDTLYVGDVFARVIFTVSVSETNTVGQFSDVASGAWYAGAVGYVSSRRIMNGVSQTRFGPETVMDRAMAVTTLYQMEKSLNPQGDYTGTADFPDVEDGGYYEKAVSWAAENQIVKGSKGLFHPEQSVTRAEFVTMLYNNATFSNGQKPESGSELSGFADIAAVPQWAAEAFGWALDAGILSGNASGRLEPESSATRAEMAAMVQKYCQWKAAVN